MDALTNGVTISNGSVTKHSFTDYGLAIGNNDYIGEPEYETHYVEVPGSSGFLDLSDAISGNIIFHSRAISIEFGAVYARNDWDARISELRNLFHGKKVTLTFDNDPNWHWSGRAEINDFDRFRELGTFTFEIPQANPFKEYNSNTIYQSISVTSTVKTQSCALTGYPVNPVFVVSSLSGTLTVQAGGKTKIITATGSYTFPDVLISPPSSDVKLKTTSGGSATVTIRYKQRSL